MARIRLELLSKHFGGEAEVAAVSDLDLDIADNQFVTLLGPSGCGKTTTLRMIAGYMAPDRGTIRVDERVLSAPGRVVPPEERGMGMVFQNYAVWPHKTVFENVVFGLRVRKIGRREAEERVERVLDLVNLRGLAGRFPNELSGGQQQRVALARSLVVEPSILLLDEPLSNLDARLRERMRHELKALQRRTGITFVYVTHDQAEALALSDRIAVMHRGRLQQFGTPEEVYGSPANRVVADFMGLVNLLPGTVAEAANGSGIVASGPLRLAVALPPGLGAGDSVEIAIRPESIALAPGGEAEIVERSYLGNFSEYQVALADGTRLRVQADARSEFPVGFRVGLGVDAARCNVFRREAAEQ
jgi:iron(III) transport system ATP-binding protein